MGTWYSALVCAPSRTRRPGPGAPASERGRRPRRTAASGRLRECLASRPHFRSATGPSEPGTTRVRSAGGAGNTCSFGLRSRQLLHGAVHALVVRRAAERERVVLVFLLEHQSPRA